MNESRPPASPVRATSRSASEDPFESLDVPVPAPSRGLGCRLGYLRHLLLTKKRDPLELGVLARAVPGLEAFLVEGVNRASVGRQPPVRRFEDILERWGVQRTEHAVAQFERRVHGPGLRAS